jgi:quercetin dioxygenase-like cupin family protein
MSEPARFRKHDAAFKWEGVETLAYKRDPGVPYRDVTRQVLFDDPALRCQLRYFEISPGGYTTLERHEHVHAVVIQRGRGRVLVGDVISSVAPFDLVRVPPRTWHQFRADEDAFLGFLCLVNHERDRPELPDAAALAVLREKAEIAAFIRTH